MPPQDGGTRNRHGVEPLNDAPFSLDECTTLESKDLLVLPGGTNYFTYHQPYYNKYFESLYL